MLTTDKVREHLTSLRAQEKRIEQELSAIRGAAAFAETLIRQSSTDDAVREEARQQAEEIARNAAEQAAAEFSAASPEVVCDDPNCVICHRTEQVTTALTGEAGRIDPAEIAIATKEE